MRFVFFLILVLIIHQLPVLQLGFRILIELCFGFLVLLEQGLRVNQGLLEALDGVILGLALRLGLLYVHLAS